MKPINTSIFDFPTLIAKGCVYVDKTAQIYELVKPSADGIYFFPRPRRFGKSLLISTLKAGNCGPFDLAASVRVNTLDAADALDAPAVALLYQGGYLTIDRRITDDIRTIDDVKCENSNERHERSLDNCTYYRAGGGFDEI